MGNTSSLLPVPNAVNELLRMGFGPLGPVKDTYATAWQSRLKSVPKGHIFCGFQRAGMTFKGVLKNCFWITAAILCGGILGILISLYIYNRHDVNNFLYDSYKYAQKGTINCLWYVPNKLYQNSDLLASFYRLPVLIVSSLYNCTWTAAGICLSYPVHMTCKITDILKMHYHLNIKPKSAYVY